MREGNSISLKIFSALQEGIGKGGLLVLLLLFSFSMQAQEVEASIDTATIKIGQQIRYEISVEANEDDLIVFPEGEDSFLPLEIVESLPTDTTLSNGRYELLKEYSLTLWDSGHYTIPQQRVLINDREFLTDTLPVEVFTVVVDTIKQRMYPIKPAVEVPSRFEFPVWGWWVLAIFVLAGLIYLFFRQKKKKEEAAKKLPPYEQAIQELRELDESHLLENREIKEYYSQLSNSVRRYLDGEVYDHAMESTTGELVAFLEAERNSGKLNIDQQTIDNLKQILQRADLAKFANSKPDMITAKEDRSKAEFVINDTKEGIPEPTEEELLQDKLYLEKKERQRKKRNWVVATLIVLLGIGALTIYLASTKGIDYVVDTYFGNPSKTLLEGDWIRSEYGTPSVSVTTPEVLKRGEVEFTEKVKTMMSGSESFLYGGLNENYSIALSTMQLHPQSEFQLGAVVDGVYEYLESQGARNILLKEEDFRTPAGVQGIKIFGSMVFEDPETQQVIEKEYAILNFAESGGFQQIVLIYNKGDKYAEEITERIQNSVELKTMEADVQ